MSHLPAPPAASAVQRDPQLLWWWLSPLLPLSVLLNVLQYASSGATLWLWALPLFTWLVLPLLDAVVGEDRRNPDESGAQRLQVQRRYPLLVAAYVPLQWAVTVAGCWVAAHVPLDVWGWAGLILSVGGANGVGINAAHELGHKPARWERRLSWLALAPALYGHFYVEHNRGHHRRVATLADPASARLGEGFWVFLPRTMAGSLQSAWALEAARLRAQGLSAWHVRNHNLQAWSVSLLLYGALLAAFGWGVLVFLLAQAAYGVSLLEVVNYIEHYGLKRQPRAGGGFEPCAPCHSWNSSHRASNLFLYQLQRHSDHHAHPLRRFPALRHDDSAPQLPSGYPAMLLLAYVPTLWFAVMDQRVLAHYGGDVAAAQLHPPRAAHLRARYAAGAAEGH